MWFQMCSKHQCPFLLVYTMVFQVYGICEFVVVFWIALAAVGGERLYIPEVPVLSLSNVLANECPTSRPSRCCSAPASPRPSAAAAPPSAGRPPRPHMPPKPSRPPMPPRPFRPPMPPRYLGHLCHLGHLGGITTPPEKRHMFKWKKRANMVYANVLATLTLSLRSLNNSSWKCSAVCTPIDSDAIQRFWKFTCIILCVELWQN